MLFALIWIWRLFPLRFRELREEQGQLDVLKGGENRDQVVHLEDEANVAGAPRGELPRRHMRDLVAVHIHRTRRRRVETTEKVQQELRKLKNRLGCGPQDALVVVSEHEDEDALRRVEALAAMARAVEAAFPRGKVEIKTEKQYANLRRYLQQAPQGHPQLSGSQTLHP